MALFGSLVTDFTCGSGGRAEPGNLTPEAHQPSGAKKWPCLALQVSDFTCGSGGRAEPAGGFEFNQAVVS